MKPAGPSMVAKPHSLKKGPVPSDSKKLPAAAAAGVKSITKG